MTCVFQIFPKFIHFDSHELNSRWLMKKPQQGWLLTTYEPMACVYLAAWSLRSQFIGCVFRCILDLLCNFIRCQIVRNRFKPTQTEHITKRTGLKYTIQYNDTNNDLYSATVKCRGARGQAVSGCSQTNMSLHVFWMTSNYQWYQHCMAMSSTLSVTWWMHDCCCPSWQHIFSRLTRSLPLTSYLVK